MLNGALFVSDERKSVSPSNSMAIFAPGDNANMRVANILHVLDVACSELRRG